jgi:hypothetical protein
MNIEYAFFKKSNQCILLSKRFFNWFEYIWKWHFYEKHMGAFMLVVMQHVLGSYEFLKK